MSAIENKGIEKFTFPPAVDMDRAEVYAITTIKNPSAVMVLCPGFNWNGGDWVAQRGWREFAVTHNVGLIGLSFASNGALINKRRGYYFASQGSGDLLLDAVCTIYGGDLPLLVYGYSGGAHFASRFVQWTPGRITAWCAYSAAWWDPPGQHENPPPGIVCCGGDDERLKACQEYFAQGRELGNPWLWVTVPGIKHVTSPKMEDFVRQYFLSVMNRDYDSCWVDVNTKSEVSGAEARQSRSSSGWMPHRRLIETWTEIQRS